MIQILSLQHIFSITTLPHLPVEERKKWMIQIMRILCNLSLQEEPRHKLYSYSISGFDGRMITLLPLD